MRALFTYSLENADQTALIYKESDDWKQIQLGDDSLVTVSAQAHENGQLVRPLQGF